VAAFYEFHQRHGVDLGDLLTACSDAAEAVRRGDRCWRTQQLQADRCIAGVAADDLVLAATAKVRKPTCNLTHPSAATSSLIVSEP